MNPFDIIIGTLALCVGSYWIGFMLGYRKGMEEIIQSVRQDNA